MECISSRYRRALVVLKWQPIKKSYLLTDTVHTCGESKRRIHTQTYKAWMLLISHRFDLEIVMMAIEHDGCDKKRSSEKKCEIRCAPMYKWGEKWNTCDLQPMDCINFSLISDRVCACVFICCAFLVPLLVQIVTTLFRFEWRKRRPCICACVHEIEIEAYANNYL